jgi:hypothetical protein
MTLISALRRLSLGSTVRPCLKGRKFLIILQAGKPKDAGPPLRRAFLLLKTFCNLQVVLGIRWRESKLAREKMLS